MGFSMENMESISRPLLPIFFVLDTSGSMTGQPISMLNHAMEEVISILGNFADTNADALLKIGVLEFSSGAKWIQPKGLEELQDFVFNPLTAGGLTDMGAALRELNQKLSRKAFLVSTAGRCKPIIIFMTDGQPTDDWETALKEIGSNNKWFQHSIKIGFAVGNQANMTILSQIVGNSEAVVHTSDLVVFNKLLQKVAINSAMIGSRSHVSGEEPDSKDILQDTINEMDFNDEPKTAKQKGINVDPIWMPDPDDEGTWDDAAWE